MLSSNYILSNSRYVWREKKRSQNLNKNMNWKCAFCSVHFNYSQTDLFAYTKQFRQLLVFLLFSFNPFNSLSSKCIGGKTSHIKYTNSYSLYRYISQHTHFKKRGYENICEYSYVCKLHNNCKLIECNRNKILVQSFARCKRSRM